MKKAKYPAFMWCEKCWREWCACAIRKKPCPVDGKTVCRDCCQHCPHKLMIFSMGCMVGCRLDKQDAKLANYTVLEG